MADATSVFFNDLASRGYEPVLQGVTATFRFDLMNGTTTDRWLVSVDRGTVKVSKKNTRADCVLRLKRSLFELLAAGEENAVAAMMRGEVGLEGAWTLLVQFQRLFPGPPSPRTSTRKSGRGRKRA